MACDGWGAPRIHAELTKLGFVISEMTVSRYLPRHPAEPDQVKRWVAFLRNQKDDITAMDLFTVPTASLRLIYGFFVIEHGRRHILHFGATFHPTAAWVIQQLRDAFPYDTAPKYLIFDRDSIFSAAVIEFIKSAGIKPVRISFRSPWQNGTAERWIGSCRRELLDHVVVLGERHFLRLVRSYINYYHEDRCHLGLDKDTPNKRAVTPRPSPTARVVALPRVGGLHHRYEWREAA
jgi:transposase InsO family protein